MTFQNRHKYIPYILLTIFLLLSISSGAQRSRRNRNRKANDTVRVDTTVQVDSLVGDTVLLDTLGKKKQPLDAPVEYESKDSLVFTQGGFATLYGDGKVNYEKIELTSAVITMNMDSSTVYARGVTDSLGVETGTPIFKDGETPYESKIMRYNFKTKKGFINGIVTQQGEGYVTSENAKKGPNDEIYLRSAFLSEIVHGKSASKEKCGVWAGSLGGRGCSFAYSYSFRFLPFQQQLFIGFHYAYLWGRNEPWFLFA